MIETLTAQNGSKVLRSEGRWLSSAIDPQAEARDWLRRRQILLGEVKTIFILGSGSGYHIAEVLASTPAQVIVVDCDEEQIREVQAIHQFDPARVQFECVQKSRELRSTEKVRQAVKTSFLVLQHAPTMAGHPEFFADCKNQLLGRDWGSLSWQWQLKGFTTLELQPKIHGVSEEALSIYDLENTELVQNSEERERMLVKALRELVK